MSDYTVKREKEGILRIQAEGTKMPGPLTINERDYADDKQLIIGGGSSSPLGLAKVKFLSNNMELTLGSVFASLIALPTYSMSEEDYVEGCTVYPSDRAIGEWNEEVDAGRAFLIAPCFLYKNTDFEYTLEGDAEFGSDREGDYIYITGDCTITITTQPD